MFIDHEKYCKILEAMPDSLYILDRELTVHYINPGMSRMLRVLRLENDLVGKKITDLIPDESGKIREEVERVYRERQPVFSEHTLPAGTDNITFELVRIPLFNDNRMVSAVLNSMHDITGHLMIKNELRESHRMFETMVDNANSIIFRINLEGNITYLNRFAETFFGYAHDELLGKSVQNTIIPPVDSDGTNISTLMQHIVEHPEQYMANENENIRKDGTRVWVSWSNKPIYDDTGEINEILCVGNDITALKVAQRELAAYRDRLEVLVEQRTRALQESEARYRFLFEESPAAAFVMSLSGTIRAVSSAFAGSLGHSRSDLIGKPVNELIGEGNSAELISLPDGGRADQRSGQVEMEIPAQNGSLRTFLFTAGKVITDDREEADSVLITGIDITGRKRAEARVRQQEQELIQADKMASLGVLVSGVAHEINNPNNYIILNTDNLVDIWKDVLPVLDREAERNPSFSLVGLPYASVREETGQLVDSIRDGACRIRSIVNHLKDFARQTPVNMDCPVDLEKVTEAALVIVANVIKKSTNRFSLAVDAGLPPVKGDFQKIEQVVINLLTNACQALTDRNQAISVSASSADEGKAITLSVRDEGKGIPPEVAAHIFDPFFTTRRDSGGTGLGLSISYGIVNDHNGTLVVESEPGKGTEFVVTLPVYENPEGIG